MRPNLFRPNLFRPNLFRPSLLAIATILCAQAFAPHLAHAKTVKGADGNVEVVVTASGYRIKKDAVMSHIDVLSQKELTQKPVQGIGDSLAYLPGVRSSSYGPGASRPVIRGLDGYRVMVLNNGLGMVDVSAASPDHAVASESFEAKSIEVLRGPSALIYGGNAIGGVVNVIDDRIPMSPASDAIDGRFSTQVSSGDRGQFAGLSAKMGQHSFVVSLDALHRQSSDYATPTGPISDQLSVLLGQPNDRRHKQPNAAVNIESYGIGASYLGEKGFVGASVKSTNSDYGVPVEEDVTIGLKQTRYDVRSRLDLEGFFSRLSLDAGATDYHHTEYEGAAIGTQFFSKGEEARIGLVRDGQGSTSLSLGLAATHRDFKAVGDESFVPSTQIKDYAVYVQSRRDEGNWGVEGGLRSDKRELKTATDARSFATVSGSVGAFWRPNDHNFYGLSLTRGERAPSEIELFADGPHVATAQYLVGNRNFKSEVGTSLELTGHWKLDDHSPFDIDAHIYVSHFDNFIDQVATGAVEDGLDVYTYVQTNADIYGLELSVDHPLGQLGGQALSLNTGYDYVHGQTDLGPVARMPPQALSFKLKAKGDGFESYLETRLVGGRKKDLTYAELPTAGYGVINLFTSYELQSIQGARLFAEVRNLTNAEIREATSATKDTVVGAGRSLRVGLDLTF